MVAGFKRKAVEGGAEETDMEALERQTRKIQVRAGSFDSLLHALMVWLIIFGHGMTSSCVVAHVISGCDQGRARGRWAKREPRRDRAG